MKKIIFYYLLNFMTAEVFAAPVAEVLQPDTLPAHAIYQEGTPLEFTLSLKSISFDELFANAKKLADTGASGEEGEGWDEVPEANIVSPPSEVSASVTTSIPNGEIEFRIADTIKKWPVEISVRGSTSIFECDFLKLKIKIPKASRDLAIGTPFERIKNFRIGTHCGEANSQKSIDAKHLNMQFGRIKSERSPVREYTAYKVIQQTGIPTEAVRMAQVTYKDSSQPNGNTHLALLLESNDSFAKRMTIGKIKSKEFEGDYNLLSLPRSAANFFALLGHILVGNVDHAEFFDNPDVANFPETKKPNDSYKLWNYIGYTIGEEFYASPVDFDLSAMVLQRLDPLPAEIRWRQAPYYLESYQDLNLFNDLQKIRANLSIADFKKIAEYYQRVHQNILDQVTQSSFLNEAEKVYMSSRIEKFYLFLTNATEIPVLSLSNLYLYYGDGDKFKKPIGCGSSEDAEVDLPIGAFTPLVFIKSKKVVPKGFLEVELLDIFETQFNPASFDNCTNADVKSGRRFFIKQKDLGKSTPEQAVKSNFELIKESIF